MGHESPAIVERPDSVNEAPSPKANGVLAKVRKMLAPLPAAYSVELDTSTHNILVCNDLLGFAISEKAIEDGIWVSGVKAAFDRLVEETNKLRGDVLVAEALNQGTKINYTPEKGSEWEK